MADYHVKVRKDGTIVAGPSDLKKHASDVTDETIVAVRDHLLIAAEKNKELIGYRWDYNNGKTLILKLEEIDTAALDAEEQPIEIPVENLDNAVVDDAADNEAEPLGGE